MKKIMLCLLITLSVLLSSCDLFMEYEKPDLYLITVGLTYNEYIGTRPMDPDHQPRIIPNTKNDANAIEELFTGFADQAGMDWYSISCRDEYGDIPAKKYVTGGSMKFQLETNTAPSLGSTDIPLAEIIASPNPKLRVLNELKNIFSDCTKQPTANDIVLFYYAGHGLDWSGHLWMVPGYEPVDKTSKDEENHKAIFLESDIFGENGLLNHVNGRKVIILDSCYSGALLENRAPENDNITGGGGSSNEAPDNPYFDHWFSLRGHSNDDFMSSDNDLLLPDNSEQEEDRTVEYSHRTLNPRPDIYIITSASPDQTASDGYLGAKNGPFVDALIDSLQPDYELGQSDVPYYRGSRITLNDIYRIVRKAFRTDPHQDPQTLLTRYDIVLFDFKR